LPVAYAVRLRPLLVLSIAAFLVWLFMEISPEIESHYGSVNIIPAVFLAAGVTLWGVGLLHRDFNSLSRLSLPYMAAGLPLTYLAAYVFTFKAAIGAAVVFTSSMLTLVISFGCVFVLSQTLRLFSKASRRVDETLLLLLMIVFVAAQYILPNLPYSHSHAAQMRPIFLLLFNLIYAASVLWLIYIGYVKQIPSYVNVGMWFFALDVLGRYVDILWGLLHTSLFFLVGGGLLIAMGVTLEKKRRKVLASFCTVGLTDAQ
ncbi:MAG: hypothetical protein L7F78_17605, partial [Syntrophales bacterium LBB04]|nr:hypothetical protein [Syntrophales bacterium LBB04]